MSGNVHEATVAGITPLARGVVKWDFRLPAPIRFRPGQFVSLRVGEDASGAAILRSYSIASSPGRADFSLILKLVEGGVASEWFKRLAVGDPVRFTGPMGFFVLDLAHGADVVFGVTGVGITPVPAMLEELLAREETGQVRLYWGNRDPEDLFWQRELDALAAAHPRFSARYFMSGAAPGWTKERGRITQPILNDLPQLAKPVFYLVGNGAMIREVKAGLVARGVDRKKQIRNEAFFDA